jgi:uncharacterized protein
MKTFQWKFSLNHTPEEIYRWHIRPGAFFRLLPPWEPISVKEYPGQINENSIARLRFNLLKVPVSWDLRHENFVENREFTDVQVQGPFRYYKHRHLFSAQAKGTEVTEEIQYKLPFRFLAGKLAEAYTQKRLQKTFTFRESILREDLGLHQKYFPQTKLKILLAGAGGTLGSELLHFFNTGGHSVYRLVRGNTDQPNTIYWNPLNQDLDPAPLEGFDVVINLSGEPLAGVRWDAIQKNRIRDSRIRSTELLTSVLTTLKYPPQVFINASATGFYGDRGDEKLLEESAPGEGFLADVCKEWEFAANEASVRGIRTISMRLGAVITGKGGMLPRLLTPFTMGLGGKMGSGTQLLSWLHIQDFLGAVCHVIAHPEIQGPVNFTSPHALTNSEFTELMGLILHRPTLATVPGALLKTLVGEMAEEVLLTGALVYPEKLLSTGYEFMYGQMEAALGRELGKVS